MIILYKPMLQLTGEQRGPLFNTNGKVIGINSAIISTTGGSVGIGFAIPSKTATACNRAID
ncbi:MAG: hypothetical protein CM15mP73_3970 [Hyphomicrobiales bacterium]|nr:MAG: hypothetical protein CM15mP73_3970 [Hyphomicrobiales bacterium]